MAEITLKESAGWHGKAPVSVRQLAQRGGFRTAHKIGRDWVVDEHEPYPDDRRVKPSEVINREAMGGLARTEQNSIARGERVRRLSKWGDNTLTFGRLWERLTPSLIDTCTPEQLAQIVDLLKEAYDDGVAAGRDE